MMIYCYGLVLVGGQVVSFDQIDMMINVVIMSVECFYLVIQLVIWGGCFVEDVMQVVIVQVYGWV